LQMPIKSRVSKIWKIIGRYCKNPKLMDVWFEF